MGVLHPGTTYTGWLCIVLAVGYLAYRVYSGTAVASDLTAVIGAITGAGLIKAADGKNANPKD